MAFSLPFHHVLLVVPISIAFWVIALAGVAAVHSNCAKGASSEDCGYKLQMEWWIIWFELILLAALAAVCLTKTFAKAKTALISFLTMVTVLLMLGAREFISEVHFSERSLKQTHNLYDAYNASAAGFVMLSIVNFLLILYVSLDLPNTVCCKCGKSNEAKVDVVTTKAIPIQESTTPVAPAPATTPYPTPDTPNPPAPLQPFTAPTGPAAV